MISTLLILSRTGLILSIQEYFMCFLVATRVNVATNYTLWIYRINIFSRGWLRNIQLLRYSWRCWGLKRKNHQKMWKTLFFFKKKHKKSSYTNKFMKSLLAINNSATYKITLTLYAHWYFYPWEKVHTHTSYVITQ